MARIRTVKPSFFKSLTVTALPKPTRLTWLGLWTYADDAGRGVDDARLIKAELWPLDDDYTAKKVEKDMQLLEANGSIRRYVVEGRRYFAVVEWRHQRIDKPTPSTLPAPPETTIRPSLPPESGRPPGIVREASVQEKEEGLGREVEGIPSGKQSSSRLSSVTIAPAEEDGLVAEAVRVLAKRRLVQRLAPDVVERYGTVNDRDEWLARTSERIRVRHGAELADMAASGVTLEAMVAAVEPQSSPPQEASPEAHQWPDFEWTLDDQGFAVERRVSA